MIHSDLLIKSDFLSSKNVTKTNVFDDVEAPKPRIYQIFVQSISFNGLIYYLFVLLRLISSWHCEHGMTTLVMLAYKADISWVRSSLV